MEIKILHDDKKAAMYWSTTDTAFGPVFSESLDGLHSAEERAEAFISYLGKDARIYDDLELEAAYIGFLMDEDHYWAIMEEKRRPVS